MTLAGVDNLPLVALVSIALAVCDVLIVTGISLMHPREPGPQYWALAYMLFAVSTIVLVLRTPQSEALMALAGNTGFVLTYACLWLGYARLLDLRLPFMAIGAILAVFLPAFTYFLLVSPDPAMRVGIVGLALAITATGASATQLRNLQPALLQSQALISILLGVAAVLHLLRGLAGFFRLVDNLDFGSGPLGAGIFLLPGLGSLLLAVASGMMMTQRQNLRLASEARTDGLTGLTSPALLDEIGLKEISRARRHSYPLCVMVFDIDHLETVNREHGYRLGDDALRQLAGALSRCLRREDFMSRSDGGSFCILLPSTRLAGAEIMAERLRVQIAEAAFELDGHPLHITASFGIAALGLHGDDWQTLQRRARTALYRAKTDGRNRIMTAPLLAASSRNS